MAGAAEQWVERLSVCDDAGQLLDLAEEFSEAHLRDSEAIVAAVNTLRRDARAFHAGLAIARRRIAGLEHPALDLVVGGQ